jgi:hypothetical protein
MMQKIPSLQRWVGVAPPNGTNKLHYHHQQPPAQQQHQEGKPAQEVASAKQQYEHNCKEAAHGEAPSNRKVAMACKQ